MSCGIIRYPPPPLTSAVIGNWFHMVSAQERLTRTFTHSSHTYTRTERTEISKTHDGETTREVRVEESTQVEPFRDVLTDLLGREGAALFTASSAPARPRLLPSNHSPPLLSQGRRGGRRWRLR